jgi:hypothetical protein
MHQLPKMSPIPPRHSIQSLKLMGIVSRLQQIMVNENITPAELVGCAEVVRDNAVKYYEISHPEPVTFTPAKGPEIPRYAPPPRYR